MATLVDMRSSRLDVSVAYFWCSAQYDSSAIFRLPRSDCMVAMYARALYSRNLGTAIELSAPMSAMTTSSSTKVKPLRRLIDSVQLNPERHQGRTGASGHGGANSCLSTV